MAVENKIGTFLWAYSLNICSKAADIGFFIILVGLLTKSDVGNFNLVMAISAFAYTAWNGGLTEFSARGFAQRTTSFTNVVGNVFASRLLMMAMTFVVLAVSKYVVYVPDVVYRTLFYGLVYQFLAMAQGVYLVWLRSHFRQTYANVLVLIESILKVSGIVIASQVTFPDVALVWGIIILSKLAVLLFIVTEASFFRKVRAIRFQSFRYFAGSGQHYLFFMTFMTLVQNRLDWFIVNITMDSANMASYAVANRFYEMVIFVLGVGATTLYPWLCRVAAAPVSIPIDADDAQKLGFLNRLQIYIGIVVIPSTLVVFPYVNAQIWGAQYTEVERLLVLLLPCILLAVTNMRLYYLALSKHKERPMLIVAAVTTAAQALFNLAAIPKWGVSAAIAGMWLLNALNIIAYALVIQDGTPFRVWNACRNVFHSAVLALSMLALSIALSPTMLLPVAIGVFCVAMLWEKNKNIRGT